MELKTNFSRRPRLDAKAVAFETRILIVDQDRQVGVAVSFMLSARRYDEVRAVRSARRAMAIADQFRPEIVFVDVELPDGGCLSVARELDRIARQPRPRLIGLAPDARHPFINEARAAGFERVLVKPVSSEELDKILGISRAAGGAVPGGVAGSA